VLFRSVFACGTAAVITPVGEVKSNSASWVVNQNQTGPITAKLREKLLAIQTGDAPDKHGWTIELVPKNA
jgi:branched-chain amino acid aminotransferase